MARAFNIIGIVLSFVLAFVTIYYATEASMAWWDDYGPSRKELTVEGGSISLVLILFFVALNIINLVAVKTMTSKVMGIIGISLTGIILLLNVLMLIEPRNISIDEMGIATFFYCFIALAWSIVGLVQAVIYLKRGKQQKEEFNEMVIDDL